MNVDKFFNSFSFVNHNLEFTLEARRIGYILNVTSVDLQLWFYFVDL